MVMKDQPDMMMTKTHIGSNEPEKRVPKTNQNGEDHSLALQDTILQIPLMDDISFLYAHIVRSGHFMTTSNNNFL